MSDQHIGYTVTPSVGVAFTIEYVDDKPDVREYLINLRRDLIRKVKELDALIAQLPIDR